MAIAAKPTYTSAAEALKAIQTLTQQRNQLWSRGQSARDLDGLLDRAWDAWRRLSGRQAAPRRPHIKLTLEVARAIRAANPQTRRERQQLAAKIGVSESTVYKVLKDIIWKEPEPAHREHLNHDSSNPNA